MKVYMVIVILLLASGFFIISNNELALNSLDNVATFFGLYSGWLGKIQDNFSYITGNVVELDWNPDVAVSG